MNLPPSHCSECAERHTANLRLRHCRASCCAESQAEEWYCPKCYPDHAAQAFLDSYGIASGELGDQHPNMVRIMALYRQER